METLVVFSINFDNERIEEYGKTLEALTRIGSYSYASKKLHLDLKNRPTSLAKPFIEKLPVLELKELLVRLQYVFLGEINTLPVIIATNLVAH